MDLTEEIIEKLCSYIRLGATLDTAAMAEGIMPPVLSDWVGKAQSGGKGVYAMFLLKLSQARAQGEILHIQRIVSDGGPKESQWLLERMYPEKWGLKRPVSKAKEKTAKILDAAFNEPKRKKIECKK
jgi:hypothetical protein